MVVFFDGSLTGRAAAEPGPYDRSPGVVSAASAIHPAPPMRPSSPGG